MSSTGSPRRVAIVGGGITGLAAALRLADLAKAAGQKVDVALFERGDRPGGVLQTDFREDGFLVERAADMFITNKPWALELCRRLGMEDDLINTNPTQRKSFVVCRGKLAPVPAGFQLMAPMQFMSVVTTPVLSLAGKLRLAAEPFIPPRRDASDESLASFVRRRLGREAFERLVQPLAAGIYTGDAEKLSMQAAMRQYVELEREHGSLVRGMRNQNRRQKAESAAASGARYGLFLAPRQGMASLVDRVTDSLPQGVLRLRTGVEQISWSVESWRVRWSNAAGERGTYDADAVIVATPAPAAAGLVEGVSAELAEALRGILYASTAVAVAGFRVSQFRRPPEGFGFVVPQVEGRQILAASFASHKFPGRAPQDTVLVRVFIGGDVQPELLDLTDDALRKIVLGELGDLVGLEGEPIFMEMIRWNGVMPQYHVGHLDRVARIDELAGALPGLELAGNAYAGVGIPDCIHSGQQAAERVWAGR